MSIEKSWKSLSIQKLFKSDKYNSFISHCIQRCLALEVGKFEKIIFNDDFFIIIQRNRTALRNACTFESHKKFIDIHITVDGEEYIDVVSLKNCPIPYVSHVEHDYFLYENIDKRFISSKHLKVGDVLILTFNDVHKTNISPKNASTKIAKLVLKVSEEQFKKEFCYDK